MKERSYRAALDHRGRAFEALGAIIDEPAGRVVGYVSGRSGAWRLTTWAGEPIMSLRPTSAYRGLHGARIHCWTGTLNGRRYSGRNGGPGLVCTFRARKS